MYLDPKSPLKPNLNLFQGFSGCSTFMTVVWCLFVFLKIQFLEIHNELHSKSVVNGGQTVQLFWTDSTRLDLTPLD